MVSGAAVAQEEHATPPEQANNVVYLTLQQALRRGAERGPEVEEACRLAIERQVTGRVPATWDDDVTAGADPADPLPSDPDWSGHTVYTDVREREGSVMVGAISLRHGRLPLHR